MVFGYVSPWTHYWWITKLTSRWITELQLSSYWHTCSILVDVNFPPPPTLPKKRTIPLLSLLSIMITNNKIKLLSNRYPYNGISFFQCGKTLATVSLIRSFGPKKIPKFVSICSAKISVGYATTISSHMSWAIGIFLEKNNTMSY